MNSKSQSQQLRNLIAVLWQHTDTPLSHEDFYNDHMDRFKKFVADEIEAAKFHRDDQRGPDTLANNMTRGPQGF